MTTKLLAFDFLLFEGGGIQEWGDGVTLEGYDWFGDRASLIYDVQFYDFGIGVRGGRYAQIDFISQLDGRTDISESIVINFGGLVENVELVAGQLEPMEGARKVTETGWWQAYDAAGVLVGEGFIDPALSTLGPDVALPGTTRAFPVAIDAVGPIAQIVVTATGFERNTTVGTPVTKEGKRWSVQSELPVPFEQNTDFNLARVSYDRVSYDLNTDPVARADVVVMPPETTLDGNVLANDDDADGEELEAILLTSPEHGALALRDDGAFQYTPDAGFIGRDGFFYQAVDPQKGFASQSAAILVRADTDVIAAVDDVVAVPAGFAVEVDLLANDELTRAGALELSVDASALLGTLNPIGAGVLSYLPPAGFIGRDGFAYALRHDDGTTTTASVMLEVVDRAPPRVAEGLLALYTFDAGTGITVSDVSNVGTALDLTIADPDRVSWGAGTLRIDSGTVIASTGAADKLNAAIPASGALTVEAWVDPANLIQDGPAAIVSLSEGAAARNVTLGQEGGSGDARLRTWSHDSDDSGAPSITAAGLGSDLVHVVYTRAANADIALYYDGALVASALLGGDLTNWDPVYALSLGNEPTAGSPWLGTFDLVAIYDRALTADEVQQNFAAGSDAGDLAPMAPDDHVVLLDPVGDQTGLPSDWQINLGPRTAKTHAMAFVTGSDVQSTQVIYEQGGITRGFNLYIQNGNLYAAVWNKAEESWGHRELATAIEANTTYTTTLVLDGAVPADGTLTLYLNGRPVGVAEDVGRLYGHGDGVGIGQVAQATLVNNQKITTADFGGTVAKLVQYNVVLDSSDLDQLHWYLADGWLVDLEPTATGDLVQTTEGVVLLANDDLGNAPTTLTAIDPTSNAIVGIYRDVDASADLLIV